MYVDPDEQLAEVVRLLNDLPTNVVVSLLTAIAGELQRLGQLSGQDRERLVQIIERLLVDVEQAA